MAVETITYGLAVAGLVNGAGPSELDAGTPVASQFAALSAKSIAAPHPVRSQEMAAACLAGLWLRYNYLDESHRISQDLASATGSFWHGIMHRREGDFGNAKYWFRRVGRHEVFDALARSAGELVRQSPDGKAAHELLEGSAWDPFRFVDLCQEAVAGPPALRDLCMQIQLVEWRLLFDHCYRRAIGT